MGMTIEPFLRIALLALAHPTLQLKVTSSRCDKFTSVPTLRNLYGLHSLRVEDLSPYCRFLYNT
jgi:hypothetical protein